MIISTYWARGANPIWHQVSASQPDSRDLDGSVSDYGRLVKAGCGRVFQAWHLANSPGDCPVCKVCKDCAGLDAN